jgi:hypothetical protein
LWPKVQKIGRAFRTKKLTRSPQIQRRRWIIIGEFLVSFVLTHISAIRLSH